MDSPSTDETPQAPKTWTFMLRRRDKSFVHDSVLGGGVKTLDADDLMRKFYGIHPEIPWSPILVTYTEGNPEPVFVGRVKIDKCAGLMAFRNANHKIPEELDPKTLCE